MTPGRPPGLFHRLEAGVVRVESVVAVVLLLSMAGLSFLDVALRFLFSSGFAWADIFLRQAVLWVAMVGASLAASQDRHIKLDIVLRMLPARTRRLVRVWVHLLTAAICALAAHASWTFVVMERGFGTVVYSGIPAWPFQAVLPAGFGLLALKFLFRLREDLMGEPGPESQESPA